MGGEPVETGGPVAEPSDGPETGDITAAELGTAVSAPLLEADVLVAAGAPVVGLCVWSAGGATVGATVLPTAVSGATVLAGGTLGTDAFATCWETAATVAPTVSGVTCVETLGSGGAGLEPSA